MTFRRAGFLSKFSFATSLRFLSAVSLLSAAGCSSDGGVERDAATMSNLPGSAGAAPSSAGAAPGSEAPAAPGTGPDLVVSESWVDAATNGVGIQGAFFTYGDGSGRTTITPDATRTQSGYCVSGAAGEVLNMDFGGTYGAVAALNLSQQVGSETANAYDAPAHGVVGFGFDIVGNTGAALRFVIKQYAIHDGFCINNVPNCESGCTVSYRIDELAQNCWTPGGLTPVATSLQALEWQITTKADESTPFDYCIENLHAVMDPAFVPAPSTPAPPAENDVGRGAY